MRELEQLEESYVDENGILDIIKEMISDECVIVFDGKRHSGKTSKTLRFAEEAEKTGKWKVATNMETFGRFLFLDRTTLIEKFFNECWEVYGKRPLFIFDDADYYLGNRDAQSKECKWFTSILGNVRKGVGGILMFTTHHLELLEKNIGRRFQNDYLIKCFGSVKKCKLNPNLIKCCKIYDEDMELQYWTDSFPDTTIKFNTRGIAFFIHDTKNSRYKPKRKKTELEDMEKVRKDLEKTERIEEEEEEIEKVIKEKPKSDFEKEIDEYYKQKLG